jgi:hypothetical protein
MVNISWAIYTGGQKNRNHERPTLAPSMQALSMKGVAPVLDVLLQFDEAVGQVV